MDELSVEGAHTTGNPVVGSPVGQGINGGGRELKICLATSTTVWKIISLQKIMPYELS